MLSPTEEARGQPGRAPRAGAMVAALANLSGTRIDRVQERRPPDGIILDLSESPTYGAQEGSARNGHFRCTCYQPLLVFNQFGDLERCLLRPVVARRRSRSSSSRASPIRRRAGPDRAASLPRSSGAKASSIRGSAEISRWACPSVDRDSIEEQGSRRWRSSSGGIRAHEPSGCPKGRGHTRPESLSSTHGVPPRDNPG